MRAREGTGIKGSSGRVAAIAARLDSVLEGEELSEALAAVRSLELKLKHRLSSRTRPLDLFVLPGDLPPWVELRAELVARAIVQAGNVKNAAKIVQLGQSTVYKIIEDGELDAQIRKDVRLARILHRVSVLAHRCAEAAASDPTGEGALAEGGEPPVSGLDRLADELSDNGCR